MNSTTDTSANPAADIAWNPIEIINVLRTHVRWWAVPAVVCAVLAAIYSLIAPRNWNATQALIVRPEAASVSDERIGKFSDLSEMKTLQETILELTKSQSVVTATLREVGPPRRYRHPDRWPTALDIEDFRECVDMRPPGGAEFGKTEVFYLSVQDTSRDRASALVAALCRQLENRMKKLRDQRAQSMIAELERTVEMANGDLAAETAKLSAFESNIGADLTELRSLNAQVGSQGGLTQQLESIQAERRANEKTHRENIRLLELLTSAQNNADELLATPNSLLTSQPNVKQLKDALVAAQIRSASLLGSRSEKHPLVVAAREAEQLIRTQLHEEVAVAVRGLKVDIELGAEREKALVQKWDSSRERISRLAESRAEYANLVASVEHHSRLVEAAQTNLADARARQAGAVSASIIGRIDGVEAGIHPVGPSRKTITAAGGMAGLIGGLGAVFLFAGSLPASRITPVEPVVTNEPGETVAVEPKSRRTVTVACTCHEDAPVVTADAKTFELNLFSGMTLEQAVRSVENRR